MGSGFLLVSVAAVSVESDDVWVFVSLFWHEVNKIAAPVKRTIDVQAKFLIIINVFSDNWFKSCKYKVKHNKIIEATNKFGGGFNTTIHALRCSFVSGADG